MFGVMTAYFLCHLWRLAGVAFWRFHKADNALDRIVYRQKGADSGAIAVLATIGVGLGFLFGYFLGAS